MSFNLYGVHLKLIQWYMSITSQWNQKKKEKYIKTLLRAKFHVVFLPQLLKIRTRGVNLKTRGSAHIQNKNSAYTSRLRSH